MAASKTRLARRIPSKSAVSESLPQSFLQSFLALFPPYLPFDGAR